MLQTNPASHYKITAPLVPTSAACCHQSCPITVYTGIEAEVGSATDMPTHHPRFDICSASYQTRRDAFAAAHGLEFDRLNHFEDLISDAYLQERARECKRFIAECKLRSGRRQREVAVEMRTDRTVISVALNHGELGSDPFANMLCDPIVLEELSRQGMMLLRRCGRAGFINATRTAAEFCNLPYGIAFNAQIYERICGALEHASGGTDCSALNVTEAHWFDVVLYTFATIEGLGCEKLWYE